MINDIQKTAEGKMQRSLEVLKDNLAKVRTGRAHTGLLDQVEVEYWGSMVPVSQVANVTLFGCAYDWGETFREQYGFKS